MIPNGRRFLCRPLGVDGLWRNLYVNITYPWSPNPPYIDIPNPVGTYRTSFTVPSQWKGREVMLHFGSITGYARVWVNGHGGGYDQMLQDPFAEFDVTKLVHLDGRANQMAVTGVSLARWQLYGGSGTSGVSQE